MKQRTLIVIAASIFSTIVVVAFALFLVQSRLGKLITVAFPTDLTLTLDGKNIAATGTTFVEPGDHTLSATRGGFKEQKQSFTIKSGQTQTFSFYLLVDDQAGADYLQKHPNEAAAIEGVQSKEFDQQSNALFNNNAILTQLPIIDNTFRIDYGVSQKKPPTAFALYIQVSDQQGRNDAKDWMVTNGYDPQKYEIIYVDPLTQKQTPGQ